MFQIIQQFIFVAILCLAIYLFTKKIIAIRRNILIGKKENLTDQKTLRWKNMLVFALGQKKNV